MGDERITRKIGLPQTERVIPKIYATPITISALKEILLSGEDRQKQLGEQKGEAAANADGWHDETFKLIEEEGRTIRARINQLFPGFIPAVLDDNTIHSILDQIIPIKPSSSETVTLGSQVTVKENGEQTDFVIVGRLDSIINPKNDNRWISNESPVGTALIGEKAGEEISVKTPNGEARLEILKVTPASGVVPQLEQSGQNATANQLF